MSIDGTSGASGYQQASATQSFGLQGLLQGLFAKADSNGNGTITLEEFSGLFTQNSQGSAPSTETSELFKQIDKDGDGQISIAEFKKFAGGMFEAKLGEACKPKSHDVSGCAGNHSALLTGDIINIQITTMTLTEAYTGQVASSSTNINIQISQALQSYGAHRQGHGANLANLFSQIDKDGNGEITTDELVAALKEGAEAGVTMPETSTVVA